MVYPVLDFHHGPHSALIFTSDSSYLESFPVYKHKGGLDSEQEKQNNYYDVSCKSELTSISWSPIISSITSPRTFSALLGTSAAKAGDSNPEKK
jgi:hypothetical protein